MPRFDFAERKAPIDWDTLSQVSVDAIIASGDTNALSQQIDNATFARVTEADIEGVAPKATVGLIRYLQLLTEYLLQVQNHLVDLSEHNRSAAARREKELQEVRQTLALRDQQLAGLRKEAKARSKLAFARGREAAERAGGRDVKAGVAGDGAVVPVSAGAGAAKAKSPTGASDEKRMVVKTKRFRCGLCNASFKTRKYLDAHIQRRHDGGGGDMTPAVNSRVVLDEIEKLKTFISERFSEQRSSLQRDMEAPLRRAMQQVVSGGQSWLYNTSTAGLTGPLQDDASEDETAGPGESFSRDRTKEVKEMPPSQGAVVLVGEEDSIPENARFYRSQLFGSLGAGRDGKAPTRPGFYMSLGEAAPAESREDAAPVSSKAHQLMSEMARRLGGTVVEGKSQETRPLGEREFGAVLGELSSQCFARLRRRNADRVDEGIAAAATAYFVAGEAEKDPLALAEAAASQCYAESAERVPVSAQGFYERILTQFYIHHMGASVTPFLRRMARVAYEASADGDRADRIVEAATRGQAVARKRRVATN